MKEEDIKRFPYGYDVKVLRKEAIIKTIDANIIDRDLALAIVRQCEIDAANFIKEGRWAGIPFIGNIRIPPLKAKLRTKESKEIYKNAKETLNEHEFVLFRKKYVDDTETAIKNHKRYRYLVSKAVGKNTKIFRRISRKKGEAYARLYCYFIGQLNSSVDYVKE